MRGSVGLILAGGGARGAYEVGVLSYLADERPELLERVRVITATSVGAVNAAFLASRGLTPDSVHELARTWRELEIDDLIAVSKVGTAKLLGAASLRFLGRAPKSPRSSLLSVARMLKLATDRTDWRGLHAQVASGRFDAVAVCATDIASGHAHLFLERRAGVPDWGEEPQLETVDTPLAPEHVLASAAIPFLFPPVKVRQRWYMDGGVRYNTPLAPAIGLGAESLLIINTRASRPVPVGQPADFPGIGHVLGKLLDSLFLDRLSFDLDRLNRINAVMGAVEGLGEAALGQFHEALAAQGRRAYKTVPYAVVQPGEDIGERAARYLSTQSRRHSFLEVLQALFEDDARSTADAASFLLFDGAFASELIALGRRDAEAAITRIDLT